MRVGVFIDGQNVTIGARYAFGREEGANGTGNMHPLLLGRTLAGECDLVEIRYVTGIPSPDVARDRWEAERRRHDLMAATDVVVLEKPLRYRWQWDLRNERDLGDPRDHKGEIVDARAKARNVGQEKGIDVWLALDALTMCTRADLDKVIIATADTDLDLVPQYLQMMPGHGGTIVTQAKVLSGSRDLRQNSAYDETIAIDEAVFAAARDDFDYERDLDESEIAKFVQRIGANTDGIRD